MSAPQILRHMMPHDIPLFAAYLYTREGQSYTAWEFDVLVGDPQDPGAHYPASQRRQALYVNALKIDAVGWLFNTPTIIEVKPNGSLTAIGQILSYQKWYAVHFGLRPRGLIVCERMSRQIQTLCMWDDIQVRLVQPANDFTVQTAINYVKPLIQPLSILPQYKAASY